MAKTAPARRRTVQRITDADLEAYVAAAAQWRRPASHHRHPVRLILLLLLTALVLVGGRLIRNTPDPEVRAVVSVAPSAQPVPVKAVTTEPRATGDFVRARGKGPVLGSGGTLRRFQVAVETGIARSADGFAGEVDRILGDRRSWIAGRDHRLQRVPEGNRAQFTVYLATARTSERMCAEAGLRTDGYTSCRLEGRVIINWDRWQHGVPRYGAPLAVYRAYAINHEVGHELGHGHESCPGDGKPAPVMMQQTYGLGGCVANAWPYLGGRRYAGNPAD
ncbi:DUF3152 domain-containing protein [Actinoplanes sp. NPDC049548]|uniref:DUF3152 domain-containing protein n=1 Tax=Actinoplanes sp. NPDC049548 TaxID=3155152 RepID=UPI00341A76F9